MPRSGGLYYTTQSQQVGGMPALILIHGAGGSSANWPYQLRRLPGWHVIAPDLPGHGNSQTGLKGSLPAYADHLWGWVEAMGLEEVALCGHSMGAAIALHMAHTAPQRVRGLLLLGAAARFSVNPQLLEKLHSPPRQPDAVRSIVQWSFARSANKTVRNAYTRQLMSNPAEVLYRDFKACAEFDFSAAAPQVRVPTLVLSGAEDQMVSGHLSVALAKALPLALQETVPNAGHMLMLEQPVQVSAILEKTLQTWK